MTTPHKRKEKSLPRTAELDSSVSGNYDGSIWAMTNGTLLWEPSEEAEQTGVSIDPEYPNWKALPPARPTPAKCNERAD